MKHFSALSLSAAVILTGCENGEVVNPLSPLRDFAGILRGDDMGTAQDPRALSRAALKALSEPVGIAVIENTGATAILVPLERNPRAVGGPIQTWTTQGQQTLSLSAGGRLVATRGLGDDLMAISHTPDGARAHHGLDSANGQVVTLLTCRTMSRGPESVTLSSGETLTLGRASEICATSDGTEVHNEFWRDPQGRARKSRQWINPGLGYLDWEVLRLR